MKKILFLSAFLFLGFGLNSCSDTDLNSPTNEENQPVENNTNDIINNLESSFEVKARAEGEQVSYPDYYCGSYFKDGILVIKVKGTNIKDYKKDLEQRCKSHLFIIEEGVNTMNELLQVRDFINSKDEIGVWKKLGISACGIDPKDGKVVVMLEDASEANINNFKNEVINSPLIKFWQLSFSEGNTSLESNKQTSSLAITPTPMIPGADFYCAQGGGSVGYRCVYKTKPCIVTAGHTVKAVGNKIIDTQDLTTKLGECIECDVTGHDLAVCTLVDKVSSSNIFKYNNTTIQIVDGTYDNVKKDNMIALKGFYHSGPGKIIVEKTKLSGRTFTEFAVATYKSQDGDSGGLIFSPNTKRAVGIHIASGEIKVDGTFQKAGAFLPCSAIKWKYGTLPKNN
ncbi:hypothetical protein [Bacteroides thetaiotaomicron]|jgi:hypothetical protein|uniref:hypothetical protein n=1 Tax=Bacteroides thetaiotaomicron TaxID=818 RepID=UPI0022E5BB58|nr:hypothetical protein [Bacteroides thetaiotaomicron]